MAEPKQASVVDSMGETPQAAEFGAALREMRIAYDLETPDGDVVQGSIYNTIHVVPK